ncbi:MAG: T9SS type A sorting domain-containing protein [Bacteroidota bacterium]
MKHKLYILLFFALISQFKSQNNTRFDETKKHFDESEKIFEGYFLKSNPSILTSKKEIITLYDFKVTKMIKGSCSSDSIIKIEFEGGSVLDPQTNMITESRDSHGNGMISKSQSMFYLYPSNERNNNRLKRMIVIANPNKLVYNDIAGYEPQPYKNLNELYNDLNKITNLNLTVEKKSSNGTVEEKEIINNPIVDYQTKSQNFYDLINLKVNNYNSSTQNKSALVNDLTLQITNTVITGSIFQFDVNIKADNNSTYLDNVPVWLTYNAAVFGSSVVANSNFTVTNGTPFNNANYFPSNSFVTDNNANTLAFAVSATVSNPIRTNITTAYKFLAQVKLKIINCGNVNVNLTNSVTAINSCFYTSTANGTNLLSYNSLNYVGGPFTNNITFCPPTIKDFNSPINGGMNQILTIKGSKFGAVRGNGQVKFRDADNFGFPYLNKLDNVDYISWNDTMIQIRMPSTIDTVNQALNNTPGGSSFKVYTNANDSVVSTVNLANNPFKVYYSIFNLRPFSGPGVTMNQKLRANLIKSNAASGGYVIRLDTSVSNDPNKKMCFIKAARDWACLTTINVKLGPDSILQGYGITDYICNVTMANASQMSAPNVIAETRPRTLNCPSTPNVKAISDFDIRINKNYLSKFIYDTLGTATIGASKIDFFEVVLHEIGHGLGHMHVTDSAELMYYRTLGNLAISIPPSQRRKLNPGTSAVVGGSGQLSASQTAITGINQCGLQTMVQFVCFTQSIKTNALNNFNALVYPNPVNNQPINLVFDVVGDSKPKITVTDLLGKIVFAETVNVTNQDNYAHQLNLNNLNNGVYLLNITSGKQTANFKIIKE